MASGRLAPLLALARRVQSQRRRLLLAPALAAGLLLLLRHLRRHWVELEALRKRRYLALGSPLQGATWKQAAPWRWSGLAPGAESWRGYCPICKRPVDVAPCEKPPRKRSPPGVRGRYAFVITLWGESIEYVLGALVLGQSIRQTKTPHALVCLLAGDVPMRFVELLSVVWECRQVDHVRAAPQLSFSDQCSRFSKVFTKLRALSLVDFEKVLLLDVDLIVMSNIDDLFNLPPPAALRRGMNEFRQPYRHGDPINGRHFFQGVDQRSQAQGQGAKWSWGQGTGINAGVMLLQPDAEVLERMLTEVADPQHPSHVQSNGPEQDYLSRFYADAPWTHIGVEYNFQLHQMFFALQPDRTGSAERAVLLRTPSRIKVVHFSGTDSAKPWQRILDERYRGYWPDRSFDAEYARIFAGEFAGYWLWVERDPMVWKVRRENCGTKGRLDLDTEGMHLGPDGIIYREVNEGGQAVCVEIPEDLTRGAMRLMRKALDRWFDTYAALELTDMAPKLRTACSRQSASHSSSSYSRELRDGWRAPGGVAARGPWPTRSGSGDRSGNLPRFRWKSTPGGWGTHYVKGGAGPQRAGKWSSASVICSAASGAHSVRFVESGSLVYEDWNDDGENEDGSLSGVFVKVAGGHCARHYRLPVSAKQLEETIAALQLWIHSVPPEATVLVALLCCDRALHAILQVLALVGVPREVPHTSRCRALAAVSRVAGDPFRDPRGAVCATHASWDVACAWLPLECTT